MAKRKVTKRAGSDGGYGLRLRAVRFEDDKARAAAARYANTKAPEPHLVIGRPYTTALVESKGYLPNMTPSASKVRPRIQRAEQMHLHGGELVFVRLSLPELNGLPPREAVTMTKVKAAVEDCLKWLAPKAVAYDACYQVGKSHGGAHVHLLMPLKHLSLIPRRSAQRAPAGEGGGKQVNDLLHVCRVEDTKKDRAAVAVYMGRDLDARFDCKDTSDPEYLDAMEDFLKSQQNGDNSPSKWHKMPRSWR